MENLQTKSKHIQENIWITISVELSGEAKNYALFTWLCIPKKIQIPFETDTSITQHYHLKMKNGKIYF